jgi:hypothetical protein
MYTDPGSSLFFVQVMAAAVGTVIYRFRRAIMDLFRSRGSSRSENN